MAEIQVTAENFDAEVKQSSIPVLVDFWAPWCGPCRMIAPIVEEIATEYEGRLKVAKVNVDEAGDLAGAIGIQSIPTLILVKDGAIVHSSIGYVPKEQLVAMLGDI